MTTDPRDRTVTVRVRNRRRLTDRDLPPSLEHSLSLAVAGGVISGWTISDTEGPAPLELSVDDDLIIAPDAVSVLVAALGTGPTTAEARLLSASGPRDYRRYTGDVAPDDDAGMILRRPPGRDVERTVFEPAAVVQHRAPEQAAVVRPLATGAMAALARLAGESSTLLQIPHSTTAAADRAVAVTVVIPTRASRPESMKDALLGLAAQTSADFEVIVAPYDAVAENLADLADILSHLGPELEGRVVGLAAADALASAISTALNAAGGRFAVVIDETDVVGTSLVAQIPAADEMVVEIPTRRQTVEPELWPGDQDGFRVVTEPVADAVVPLATRRFAVPMAMVDRFSARTAPDDAVGPWEDLVDRLAMVIGAGVLESSTIVVRDWVGLDDAAADEARFARDAWARWSAARPEHSFVVGGRRWTDESVMDPDAMRVHGLLVRDGRLRPPIRGIWRLAGPGIDRIAGLRRRLRGRGPDGR